MMPLEQKIETLIGEVEDTIAKVESSHLVDCTALNRRITEACLEAQQAAPEIAVALKLPLGRLITRLDDLAAAIKAYQDRIQRMH